MNQNEDKIIKWIDIAEKSLQADDFYSATRELSGALVRILMQEENDNYKKYFRKIVSLIIEYKRFEVLYSVLTEALKLLKMKKRIETIETILFISFEELEHLDDRYNQKIEFLKFATFYSVDFAVEEAEILTKSENLTYQQLDDLFTMILPTVLKIETYETLKSILFANSLIEKPKYVCYHILIEILLGAGEEKLNVLLDKLLAMDKIEEVQTTIEIVNSIMDENNYKDPMEILTDREIDDSNLILLVKKLQQANY